MSEGFADCPGGGRLWFEVAGDGPVVTFVHPGLWDARTWDREFVRFADAGFRCLRYDVRGYGRSSRPSGTPYSHVDDLLAVLDAADVNRTAVVGCSMGGSIALDTTLEHPERVWALVPVAAGLGGFEALDEEEAWWETHAAGVDAAVEAGDLGRAQDLRMAIWAPLGTDDAAGRRIREIAFENLHELTMDESAAVELDPPAAQRLGEIHVPTLVVVGLRDTPFSLRTGTLIADGIPGARRIDIDDADHVVNLRSPEAFEAAVLPFLREVA